MSEQKKRARLFNIVNDYDEEINAPLYEGGILARLFVLIMYNAGVTTHQLANLLIGFAKDAKLKSQRQAEAKKVKDSAKGNLVKELGKRTMTWKVFLKGLRFLRVQKFSISVTVWWSNKPPTTVSITRRIGEGLIMDDGNEATRNVPEQYQSDTAKQFNKKAQEQFRIIRGIGHDE